MNQGRKTRSILAILLVLILLAGLFPNAFAAEKKPGPEDLQKIGSQIEYPRESEYLEEYRYATVTAPGGHSVLGFGSADHQGSSYTVLNGEMVKVLAERNGYACCIVMSQEKARWINTEYLEPAEAPPEEYWTVLSYVFTSKYGGIRETEYLFEGDEDSETSVSHDYIPYENSETWTIETLSSETEREKTYEVRDWLTGELMEIHTVRYAEDGRVDSDETRDAAGNLLMEQRYGYSADQRSLDYCTYDDNGNEDYHFIRTMDLDGNPLRVEYYYDNSDKISRLEETAYDEEGRAVSGHVVSYSDQYEDYEYDVAYEYDREGILVRKVQTGLNGYYAGEEEITEYRYDAYGNKLEERQIDGSGEIGLSSWSYGLIRNGKLVETSGEICHIEKPDDTAHGTARTGTRKSTGTISLTETELLDAEGIRIDAVGYDAKGNQESMRLYTKNETEEDCFVVVERLKINGHQTNHKTYLSIPAGTEGTQTLSISQALLDAAGVDHIEEISMSFKLEFGYETVYESDSVSISVQDQRERVSGMISIPLILLENDRLTVKLIGCELSGSLVTVYFKTENRSDADLKVTGGDGELNGESCDIYYRESVPAGTELLSEFNLHYEDYSPVSSIDTMSFLLQLAEPGGAEFGESDRITVSFTGEGGTETEATGKIKPDRSSAFWNEHFAAAGGEKSDEDTENGQEPFPILVQGALNAEGQVVYVVSLRDYTDSGCSIAVPGTELFHDSFFGENPERQACFRFAEPIPDCVYFSVPIRIESIDGSDETNSGWSMFYRPMGATEWLPGADFSVDAGEWLNVSCSAQDPLVLGEFAVVSDDSGSESGAYDISVDLAQASFAFADREAAEEFVLTVLAGK